ncbi:MAG TPA: histidinol-phosphate transaminase [Clostridiales bacterium]|nr:histidinol-phosphate transaminase [Clostridiales bacterium]
MKKYWSEKARGLTPYTAGEQPKRQCIKLNTNENAYGPSPTVLSAITEAARSLRLYPAPDSGGLRQAAAACHGVTEGQVFCANGSDEALAFCFQAFFDPSVPVKTMDVTYSFYPVWAKLFGLTLEEIPLLPDFTADVAGLSGGGSVVIANPNAPTGIALPLAQVEEIVKRTSGIVIVDEAYAAFGAQSAVPLIARYDNLVVVRTLSKSHSLAGLRVGYVLAHENLISALNTIKDSFNSYPLDRLAQAGAAAALSDTAYYEAATAKIIATREYTVAEFEKRGFTVLPSSANFIFVRFMDAEGTAAALRSHGILVRYFPGGRTKDFLRVTIGTAEQMNELFTALEELKCR